MDIRDKELWLEKYGVLYSVEFNEEKGAFNGVWMSLQAKYTIRRDGASRDVVADKTYDGIRDSLYTRCAMMEKRREDRG